MLRGPVLLAGVIFITGFQLGHLSGATPAQALWLALVLLGIYVNFTFPWRFPRTAATPLGRRVLLLGEFLSMAALAFVIDALLTKHGVARHVGFGDLLFYMVVAALAVRFVPPRTNRRDLR